MDRKLLNPQIQDQLLTLLDRFDGLQGVLISTMEGVPLVKSIKPGLELQNPYDLEDPSLISMFATAADQASKLKFGEAKSLFCLFGKTALIHINNAPIVITLLVVANGGDIAAILSSTSQIKSCFHPIKEAVEKVDHQT